MLLLGFHLVHSVKPMELKKRILLIVCNRAGEIIRNNENKNNLSFNLISHLGETGKIHLTLSETSSSAVMMTDKALRSVLLENYSSPLHGKGDRHERVRDGVLYAKSLKTRELLWGKLTQLIPPHQALRKPQNCPRAWACPLLLEGPVWTGMWMDQTMTQEEQGEELVLRTGITWSWPSLLHLLRVKM